MKRICTILALVAIVLGTIACSSFEYSRTDSGSTLLTLKGITYNYEYKNKDRHYKVQDAAGTVFFDGPVNTRKQRAAVPKAYADWLERWEKDRKRARWSGPWF